jgi:hypothetical protein
MRIGYRYSANANVRTTRYLMPDYELYVNGQDWDQENACWGEAKQWVDGPF